jgi:hypothetical protein
MTAICPGVSHPEVQVGGAERGDEGVHLLPQHGGGTADAAAGGADLPGAVFMSSDSESVVAWRSPAGPARSISSA